MALFPRVSIGLGVLAVLGSCVCVPALAADGPVGAPPRATDVTLGPDGLLSGRVLDAQGAPAANLPVSLQLFNVGGNAQNPEIAAVVTDPQGHFAIRGVRGGLYQLITPQGRGIYRLWVSGTAPSPSAPQVATLVVGGDTVRGAPPQGAGAAGAAHGTWKYWLTNPLVIGGVVATAIVVPVAIANANRSSPASP
jgi:hypothetical protein